MPLLSTRIFPSDVWAVVTVADPVAAAPAVVVVALAELEVLAPVVVVAFELNAVIALSRARAVRPSLATDSAATDLGDLSDDIDRVLTAWQVEEALRMLSEEHRSALVEVHYKGRSYGDVALDLGVPVGT